MAITTTSTPRAVWMGNPVQSGHQPDPAEIVTLLTEILTLAASASDLSLAVTGLEYQGVWDADANSPTIPAAAGGNDGYFYVVGTAGTTTIDGVSSWAVGDYLISDGSAWHQVSIDVGVITVAGKTGAITLEIADISDATAAGQALFTAADVAAQRTALGLATVATSGDSDDLTEGAAKLLMTVAERAKLAGVETGATADQTGAEIKAAYEAEGDTNAFTDAEKTKLAGVETGATADQTGAEIKAAYEAEGDTNAFTDAEKTKLAGVETGAQVNDVMSVAGRTGAVTLSKSDVGLSNVDDTADADKPVSTAQQTALDGLDTRIDHIAIVDVNRPGEAPEQFSEALTGEPEDRAAVVTGAAQVDDDLGKVWAYPGAGVIGPRRAYAVEADRIYRLRVIFKRLANSDDPSGDAVQLKLRNLSKTKATVSTTTTTTYANPTLSDGAIETTVIVSRDAGASGVQAVPPATARYVTPYIEMFGDTPTTGVALFEWADITDIQLGGADVAALQAGLAAETTARESADALDLKIGSNLSDLSDAEAALVNLGLGDLEIDTLERIEDPGDSGPHFTVTDPDGFTVVQVDDTRMVMGTAVIEGQDADLAHFRVSDPDGFEALSLSDGRFYAAGLEAVQQDGRSIVSYGTISVEDGLADTAHFEVADPSGFTVVQFSDDRMVMGSAVIEGQDADLAHFTVTDQNGFEVLSVSGERFYAAGLEAVRAHERSAVTDAFGFTFDDSVQPAALSAPLLPTRLFGVAGVSFGLHRDGLIEDRDREARMLLSGGTGYQVEGQEMLRADFADLGVAATVSLRDMACRARYGEQSVSVHAAAQSPVSGDTPAILLVGDSITHRGAGSMLDYWLGEWGYTPTWIGTLTGEDETDPTDGTTTLSGTLGEGKPGHALADLTYLFTGRVSPLSPYDKATYDALSTTEKRLRNTLLVAESGEPAADVRNGYVLDFASYISLHALSTPDMLVIGYGTNDIRDCGADIIRDHFHDEYSLVFRRWFDSYPNKHVVVWVPGTAAEYERSGVWRDKYVPALKGLIKAATDETTANAGTGEVLVVPAWAMAAQGAGYDLSASAETADADTGAVLRQIEDTIHPTGGTRFATMKSVAAAIACASTGEI